MQTDSRDTTAVIAAELQQFCDRLPLPLMRVRAVQACSVNVAVLDRSLQVAQGDESRTELSCKCTHGSLTHTFRGTRLGMTAWWQDTEAMFGVAMLRPNNGAVRSGAVRSGAVRSGAVR